MYHNRQGLLSRRCIGGRDRQRWQSTLWLAAGLWLTAQRQAIANGDHLHIGPGGVFFLILGGLIFLGGLGMVLYFLFRGESDSDDDEENAACDESDERSRGESENP